MSSTVERIRRILSGPLRLDPSTIKPADTLESLGLEDEVTRDDIVIALENEFLINIPNDDVMKLTGWTVQQLADYIAKQV